MFVCFVFSYAHIIIYLFKLLKNEEANNRVKDEKKKYESNDVWDK